MNDATGIKTIGFDDIRVGEGLEFKDISDEEVRSYMFARTRVVVDCPIALRVSDSGSHYVIDDEGVVHCVPKGWVSLSWRNKPGKLHVRF